MRTVLIILGILVLLIGAAYFFGPRLPLDLTLKASELPEDLDTYLAESEATFSDLRPDARKEIIWADSVGQKTPYSVVYIHGFTASRVETAPLSDTIAVRMGANLFYSRLTGHGRSADAMAEATINDLVNDVAEAYRIGQRIGDRVILIATSMGGALTSWVVGASGMEQPYALVLTSPCFALKKPEDQAAIEQLLGMPWPRTLIRSEQIGVGPYRGDGNPEELSTSGWTDVHASESLLFLGQAIQAAEQVDYSQLSCPTFVVYSPNDQVVDPAEIEARFALLGSDQKDSLQVLNPEDPGNHVLAGDALSPSQTEPIAEAVVAWLNGLQ